MAALTKAVQNERFRQARILLNMKIDVNMKNSRTRTALMELCFLDEETKAASLAKLLLAYGAKVGIKDGSGKTALSYACMFGREQLVSLMVEEGYDFNLNEEDKDGNTALHYAASSGNFVVLNLMIKALKRFRLSVDKANKKGETPLMCASKSGHYFCKTILISEGKASEQARDYLHFKTADEWSQTRPLSSGPPFNTPHLRPLPSATKIGPERNPVKPSKLTRPKTAPDNSASLTTQSTQKEGLQQLFRVYEAQCSEAFRTGVKKPRPPSSSGTDISQISSEAFCSISPSRPSSPASLCSTAFPGRRFSVSKFTKLAVTGAAFRRRSIATAASTPQLRTGSGRRASQAISSSTNLVPPQALPNYYVRGRRASVNLNSGLNQTPESVISREKDVIRGCRVMLSSKSPEPSQRLISKLQTLTEVSNSDENQDTLPTMVLNCSI